MHCTSRSHCDFTWPHQVEFFISWAAHWRSGGSLLSATPRHTNAFNPLHPRLNAISAITDWDATPSDCDHPTSHEETQFTVYVKQCGAELAGAVCQMLECNRRWSSMKRKMNEELHMMVQTQDRMYINHCSTSTDKLTGDRHNTVTYRLFSQRTHHTVQTEGSL